MYEYESPGSGPALKAWFSEEIRQARVTSTPGGIALDADGVRELRDELDSILARFEEVTA